MKFRFHRNLAQWHGNELKQKRQWKRTAIFLMRFQNEPTYDSRKPFKKWGVDRPLYWFRNFPRKCPDSLKTLQFRPPGSRHQCGGCSSCSGRPCVFCPLRLTDLGCFLTSASILNPGSSQPFSTNSLITMSNGGVLPAELHV